MKLFIKHTDFLSDDLFIYWSIHPTKELDAFWGQFLQENEDLRDQFNEAVVAFDQIRHEQPTFLIDEASVKQKLDRRIERLRKRKLSRIFTLSTVAVLLLALVSTLFVLNKSGEDIDQELSSIGKVMNHNKVQLLAGNDVLDIDDNSTLNLSEKKNSAIIHDPLSHKEVKLDDSQPYKLIVPFGKRTSIVLADGSRVYLNSGTEMEFPTAFTGPSREISVEGEIFIEVAEQNKMPFIIHTPRSHITVYGTSFNVSSYADENKESVVLVNGSVEVRSESNSLILKPSEMAEIENGGIQRKYVDVSDYTSWKNGYMQLNKVPLNEVLIKIGRYYNVEFKYNTDLNLHNKTCSGKLFLSDNLEDVLEAFSRMTFLTYDKNREETIYINH